MPFNNRPQFDKQWDFTIPIILCTFLGLAAQIDLLVRVTIFWNLPNRNFNTFIAQLTFTSHDESWENLFVDIHIDRQRSDRVNPTPGRSPYSSTLQYVRNQRSHPDAPQCQNLSLVCSVVGRHLGCPRCTVIGTQCVWRLILEIWSVDLSIELRSYDCEVDVIEGLVFTRNN